MRNSIDIVKLTQAIFTLKKIIPELPEKKDKKRKMPYRNIISNRFIFEEMCFFTLFSVFHIVF
ncbi:MAG TPA: hypothetical protein PLP13_05560 [bacterium]|nr:hypothetical protein [bacterium]